MGREGHNIIAGLHTRVAGKRISWMRNRISAMMRSESPLSDGVRARLGKWKMMKETLNVKMANGARESRSLRFL